MKKNLRIRVVNSCSGNLWWYAICVGNRQTSLRNDSSEYKGSTIRNAKAMAKRIGIKYDSEIIRQHGC